MARNGEEELALKWNECLVETGVRLGKPAWVAHTYLALSLPRSHSHHNHNNSDSSYSGQC